jgi:hypothetical protein
LAAGFLPTFTLLLEPLWRSIFKTDFVSAVEALVSSIENMIPQAISPQTLAILVASIPCLAGLAAFLLQARTGFNLQGPGAGSVYLPHGFREVITFIRNVQDKRQNVLQFENVKTKPEDASTQASARAT